jgi:formylglycine-generating enzyme required for sulfatase activity
MSGNVWQWVLDCFRDNYNRAPTQASQPVEFAGCRRRVLRGGSWADVARDARVAAREVSDHRERRATDGFRIARLPQHLPR